MHIFSEKLSVENAGFLASSLHSCAFWELSRIYFDIQLPRYIERHNRVSKTCNVFNIQMYNCGNKEQQYMSFCFKFHQDVYE